MSQYLLDANANTNANSSTVRRGKGVWYQDTSLLACAGVVCERLTMLNKRVILNYANTYKLM